MGLERFNDDKAIDIFDVTERMEFGDVASFFVDVCLGIEGTSNIEIGLTADVFRCVIGPHVLIHGLSLLLSRQRSHGKSNDVKMHYPY